MNIQNNANYLKVFELLLNINTQKQKSIIKLLIIKDNFNNIIIINNKAKKKIYRKIKKKMFKY